jgi:rSAM/selenodomain-associated transferase 2
MRVSVIIPALNEIRHLPATLAALSWAHEVIVADGGSTDGTPQLPGVIDAPPGKGNQLNAGAAAASGDVLLFLHADCLAPPDAGLYIAEALHSPRVAGGCFEVRFAGPPSLSLRLVARGINLRSRLTRTATGDQGIFVRRAVFDQAGGFPNWPLFEDVEFVRRIKRAGQFRVLPTALLISPRRHLAHGVWRTVVLIWALRLGYWSGVSPFRLKQWFTDERR